MCNRNAFDIETAYLRWTELFEIELILKWTILRTYGKRNCLK